MDLNQIYTQLILEHSRNEANKRKIEDPTYTQLGRNPSCGDEITLQVKMDEDDKIEDIAFTGVGCAISQASTSIMADTVKGLSRQEAIDLAESFIKMISGELDDEEKLEDLGDAVAFENIQNMPARVKCAVLGWYTLKDVLENGEDTGSFHFD